MPSYVGHYRAVRPGGCLIGAVTHSQTCRYGTHAEAQQRLDQVIAVNGGPDICTGEVRVDARPPEIFRHCGTFSQSVGCYCPGCRRLLTKDDARAYAAAQGVNQDAAAAVCGGDRDTR